MQAATLTSVMGLAWASSAGGGTPPSHGPAFDHLGLPSAGVEEDVVGTSSPLGDVGQAGEVTASRASAEATAKTAAAKGRGRADTAVQAASRGTATDAGADRPAPSSGMKVSPAPAPEAWRTNPIARHETVTFVQPSPMTVLVGFHEAAMPGARPLTAAADLDQAHGRHVVAASDRDDSLATAVLPTRARTTDAASAMDIVIPVGQSVYSPVSGTVMEVDPYMLYGTHPDHRLVIVPDERPDLRVVILHVTGVQVKPGDTLTAGESKLADSANPFPFESQIDRFARPLMKRAGPVPHVHIELRRPVTPG